MMLLRRAALATALTVLIACGGDDGPAASRQPASIAFAEPTASVALHGSAQLAPIVRDADGSPIVNATGLAWESSNADIASVDAAGIVHGHALGGPVTIKARAGAAEGTLQVSVVPASAVISPAVNALAVGVDVQLDIVATDAVGGAIPKGNVVWSSNRPDIASVDQQTGALRGVAVGTAVITAQAEGFAASTGVYVGVPKSYDGLFLSTDTPNLDVTMTVYLGRVTQFSADYRPSPECRMEFGAAPFVEVPALNQTFQFRLANWSVNATATVVNDSVIVGSVAAIPASALSPGCLVHYGLSNTPNLETRNVLGTGFTIYRP